jgi:hypothetical protein
MDGLESRGAFLKLDTPLNQAITPCAITARGYSAAVVSRARVREISCSRLTAALLPTPFSKVVKLVGYVPGVTNQRRNGRKIQNYYYYYY